jgi:hypothetical protein
MCRSRARWPASTSRFTSCTGDDSARTRPVSAGPARRPAAAPGCAGRGTGAVREPAHPGFRSDAVRPTHLVARAQDGQSGRGDREHPAGLTARRDPAGQRGLPGVGRSSERHVCSSSSRVCDRRHREMLNPRGRLPRGIAEHAKPGIRPLEIHVRLARSRPDCGWGAVEWAPLWRERSGGASMHRLVAPIAWSLTSRSGSEPAPVSAATRDIAHRPPSTVVR